MVAFGNVRIQNLSLHFFFLFLFTTLRPCVGQLHLPENRAIAVFTLKPPRIDGKVDKVWLNAPSYNGFIQREPEQGEVVANDTRFYILYDNTHIYFLFVMLDNDPASIPARLLDRDQSFEPDDNINFYLDTYNDHRKAFFFSTNPTGVERDALISENGTNIDFTWDTIFKVAARINNYGWVAEFSIPYKSLRFTDELSFQIWGFNVWRMQKKSREISYWSLVNQDYQIYRLDKGGVLIGMKNIESGHNLNLLPYVTNRNITSDTVRNKTDFELGLDLKYGVTSDLTLDWTINPDFGQVEIDEEQINLDKRYEIQLEEKRPFFLENTNLFQTPFYQLFYSRRIGIESDLKTGAKVTGKIGGHSIGILGAFTGGWENFGLGDPNTSPTDELFSIIRIQRDVLSSSNIGAMYVNRTTNIGGQNRAYSHAFDFDYSIYLGQSYFSGQGVYSFNSYGIDSQEGWGLLAQGGFYGRLLRFDAWALSYSPEFNIDYTGYFPKISDKGSTQIGIYADIHPLVNYRFLRSWGISVQPSLIDDSDENKTAIGVKSIAWLEFPDQSKLRFGLTPYQDVESDKFSSLFGFKSAPQLTFWGTETFIELETDLGKPIAFRVKGSFDKQYYFQNHTIGLNRGVEGYLKLKPASNAYFELGYQTRKFLDKDNKFMPDSLVGQSDVHIFNLRARYLFSQKLFSRLFFQITNAGEELVVKNDKLVYEVWDRMSANFLFGWRFSLGSTFYFAYTEEWDKRGRENYRSSNRIIYFKISYLWSL
jgi:hypothetical protein